MQLRFFTIPIHGGESTAEELNRFLAAQRILAVERHLVQDGGASAWAVCVAFEPAGEGGRPPTTRRGKVDYREVLSEADFAAYARLRSLRKETRRAGRRARLRPLHQRADGRDGHPARRPPPAPARDRRRGRGAGGEVRRALPRGARRGAAIPRADSAGPRR